jgi:hypothetical protein
VAAALGAELARRGERTLVFGWTVSDPIGPWFGLPPSGLMPQEVRPRFHAANYRLDATLRLYFVEHLRLPRFYRHVIDGKHVRKLIEASPGIAELFFIGHLWWLSTLAASEADLHFDRIIVDAPATGHGASLFDLPGVLSSLRATGLVALEADRVMRMMSDPAWTGAVVVTLAEELAAEETLELVPRLTERTGRPPLAVFVNRSTIGLVGDNGRPDWLGALGPRLSVRSRAGLDTVFGELQGRSRAEQVLRRELAGMTEHGVRSLREQLALPGGHSPARIVERLQGEVALAQEGSA